MALGALQLLQRRGSRIVWALAPRVDRVPDGVRRVDGSDLRVVLHLRLRVLPREVARRDLQGLPARPVAPHPVRAALEARVPRGVDREARGDVREEVAREARARARLHRLERVEQDRRRGHDARREHHVRLPVREAQVAARRLEHVHDVVLVRVDEEALRDDVRRDHERAAQAVLRELALFLLQGEERAGRRELGEGERRRWRRASYGERPGLGVRRARDVGDAGVELGVDIVLELAEDFVADLVRGRDV